MSDAWKRTGKNWKISKNNNNNLRQKPINKEYLYVTFYYWFQLFRVEYFH